MASTTVSSLPSLWYTEPSSSPMTPPPMTSNRLGTLRKLTASRAPMICLPSNLNAGSSMVELPVARTMAFDASMVSVPPSRVFTSTCCAETKRASP